MTHTTDIITTPGRAYVYEGTCTCGTYRPGTRSSRAMVERENRLHIEAAAWRERYGR